MDEAAAAHCRVCDGRGTTHRLGCPFGDRDRTAHEDAAVAVSEEDLALALCGWHHSHRAGDPVPCVQSRKEAAAVLVFLSKRLR